MKQFILAALLLFAAPAWGQNITATHDTFMPHEDWLQPLAREAQAYWNAVQSDTTLLAGAITQRNEGLRRLHNAMTTGTNPRTAWTGTIADINTFTVTYDQDSLIETITVEGTAPTVVWNNFSAREKAYGTRFVAKVKAAWDAVPKALARRAARLPLARKALIDFGYAILATNRSMNGITNPNKIVDFQTTWDPDTGDLVSVYWEATP